MFMMPLITKNHHPSSSVRNLGVIFDHSVDMEDHIKKDIQDMSCPFNQHKYKISSYLDREPTGAIIHAFVTTNLDYCNAILYVIYQKRVRVFHQGFQTPRSR